MSVAGGIPELVGGGSAAAEAYKGDEPAAWSVQPKHAADKHGDGGKS